MLKQSCRMGHTLSMNTGTLFNLLVLFAKHSTPSLRVSYHKWLTSVHGYHGGLKKLYNLLPCITELGTYILHAKFVLQQPELQALKSRGRR